MMPLPGGGGLAKPAGGGGGTGAPNMPVPGMIPGVTMMNPRACMPVMMPGMMPPRGMMMPPPGMFGRGPPGMMPPPGMFGRGPPGMSGMPRGCPPVGGPGMYRGPQQQQISGGNK